MTGSIVWAAETGCSGSVLHTKKETVYYKVPLRRLESTHCYSGKAIRITQIECVFIDLGIQKAMRFSHIVICSLSCSTIF